MAHRAIDELRVRPIPFGTTLDQRCDRPSRVEAGHLEEVTSWLSLAPGNKVSSGRLLSSKTRRSANRAAALLRIAAVNIGRAPRPARRDGGPGRGDHRQMALMSTSP